VSIETPSEIFLRSRRQFLRTGDLEDAAEVYLSLLNLHQHGLRVQPSDTTVSAFNLLRTEKGLISDLSPRGDLLYKKDNLERTLGFLEQRTTGRLRAEKEPIKHRYHHTTGRTKRTLLPPNVLQDIVENLSTKERRHIDMTALPLKAGQEVISPNGNIDARELWNLIRDSSDSSSEMMKRNSVLRDMFVNGFFSHRPTSEFTFNVGKVPTLPGETGSYGTEAEFPDISGSGGEIESHPLEDLPTWSNLSDKLRREYGNPSVVRAMDRAMQRYEEKHSKQPHHAQFGSYGINSTGRYDMFMYGYSKWQEEMENRYGTYGNESDFVEHMILRMEGVPEDDIYDKFYDENGNHKGKDTADSLIRYAHRKASPDSLSLAEQHRWGQLPYLLGLEALPTEEAKEIVHWFIDGGHASGGKNAQTTTEKEFGIPGEFFSTATDGRGLLNRIFRIRDGAIQSALIRAPHETSHSLPNQTGMKDMASEDLEHLAILAALKATQSRNAEGKLKGKRYAPSLYESLMFDNDSDYIGHLPEGDGSHSDEEPVLSDDLISEWVKSGQLQPIEGQRVREVAKKMMDNIQKDIHIAEIMAPYDIGLMEDEDGRIIDCPWSSSEHAVYDLGGFGKGACDYGSYDMDMNAALFSHVPTDMTYLAAGSTPVGRSPADQRLRSVMFPDSKRKRYGDDGEKSEWEEGEIGSNIAAEISGRSGRESWNLIETNAYPLVADWFSKDEEDEGLVNFMPWFGHRYPRDRDILMSPVPPVGSNIFSGARHLSSTHWPFMAHKKATTYDTKTAGGSSARGRRQIESGYRRTRGYRGDSHHVKDDSKRQGYDKNLSANVGRSSFTEGSIFPQHIGKNISPEQMFHLLQMITGHSSNHGVPHDLFDQFIESPDRFFSWLHSNKDTAMPSELHGGVVAPLLEQMALANLTSLRNEDGDIVDSSPTQNAEYSHAIYHYEPGREVRNGIQLLDDSGKIRLNGMEPNTAPDSISQRFHDLKLNPSSIRVEDLLIFPDRWLYEDPQSAAEDSVIGNLTDLRSSLNNTDVHPLAPKSQDRGFHQKRMRDSVPPEDLGMVLETEFPADSKRQEEGRWTGSTAHYDTLPLLDRVSSNLMITNPATEDLSGFFDLEGGNYASNFPKWLLTSPLYSRFAGAQQTAEGGEDVGGGLQQVLGGGAELSPGVARDDIGLLLAPEPYTLMQRHAEALKELLDARDDDGLPFFPEDDMAREKIEEAIRQQQHMAVSWAYGPSSNLGDESMEHHEENAGHASAFFRRAADTMDQIGLVMHGLLEHWGYNEHPLLDGSFEANQEGVTNIANLFEYVDQLVNSSDQSWREPLAQSLISNGDVGLAERIRSPHTRSHWVTPDITSERANEDMVERIRRATGQQSTRGIEVLRHYLESGWHPDTLDDEIRPGWTKKQAALRALDRLGKMGNMSEFHDSIGDHAKRIRMSDGSYLTGEEFKALKASDEPDSKGNVVGFTHTPGHAVTDDYAALMEASSVLNEDSKVSQMLLHGATNQPLEVPRQTKTGKAGPRNLKTHKRLGSLLDYYTLHSDDDGFTATMSNREKVASLPFYGDGFKPMTFTGMGIKSPASTKSYPSVHIAMGEDGLPTLEDSGWRLGRTESEAPSRVSSRHKNLIHFPPNVYTNILTRAGRADVPTWGEQAIQTPNDNGEVFFETPTPESKNVAQQTMFGTPVSEGAADYGLMELSLDVLTNTDLLLKEGPKYSDTPPPVKPMHRIFSLDDLQYLKGFSGDWVVSSWPEGERLMITKKGNHITARNAEGEKIDLPNNIRAGLRGAHKKGFIIDALWDNSTLLIVDILKTADETMENMPTKDRSRHLRANFEATEEVLIPAPINTKRTDESGLAQVVKDLRREKGVKQILLRDAEATYMRGEMRHPKWVLLVPEKQLDVLVLSSSGKNMCLGIGPILEEVAKKIGNRALKHEGSYYMDVGHLANSSLEVGQFITVKVTGVTKQNRKGESVYSLNSPRYDKDSESSATDSLTTLDILSGDIQKNVPHTIKVSKSSIYLSLPTGQVIYDVDEYGNGYILKDVDYPDDYTLRVAESQRDYWSPLATVLLRSEKEKEAVVPEPPANHDKDPKKVIPKKDRILKDPKIVKTMVTALEMIESMLKEKITWTGPKGLGMDYATPVESPSGPTQLTEPHHLPDHDPAHRQKKEGDCWCGAKKGEECQQGMGHKMEECSKAHPPKKEESADHLKISRYSRRDSSV